MGSLWVPLVVSLEVISRADEMRHWFGCWHPWVWDGYTIPYGYAYGDYGYGYPRGAVPREEELAILEEQERCLSGELDGVRKRI
jgi:hypothetical protein